MSRKMAALLLAWAQTVAAGNLSLASGGYGGSLGAGGATAAERSAFGQNPAALSPGRFGLRLDFHRPYGLGDLQVAEAGASADLSHAGIALDWRETTIAGWYAEQGFQCAPSYRFGGAGRFPGSLDLGLALAAWRTAWPGRPPTWSLSQGAGFAWRPLPRLKAGGFAAGLPAQADGPRMDRVFQFGLEASDRDPEAAAARDGESGAAERRTGGSQILRLDFRKTGATPWRALASLSVRPHPSFELTGGLAAPPFQLSLGCRLSWRGTRIHQALRYHRYLGRTWLTGLAYSRALCAPPVAHPDAPPGG
jgi:hypothetical protein